MKFVRANTVDYCYRLGCLLPYVVKYTNEPLVTIDEIVGLFFCTIYCILWDFNIYVIIAYCSAVLHWLMNFDTPTQFLKHNLYQNRCNITTNVSYFHIP